MRPMQYRRGPVRLFLGTEGSRHAAGSWIRGRDRHLRVVHPRGPERLRALVPREAPHRPALGTVRSPLDVDTPSGSASATGWSPTSRRRACRASLPCRAVSSALASTPLSGALDGYLSDRLWPVSSPSVAREASALAPRAGSCGPTSRQLWPREASSLAPRAGSCGPTRRHLWPTRTASSGPSQFSMVWAPSGGGAGRGVSRRRRAGFGCGSW